MPNVFLSIIIPCYNCELKIIDTLKSVELQTNKDFELIFINDGSIDNSLQVASNYLKNVDFDYRILSQENRGVSSARNHGLKYAKGKYIYFLDADDKIDKNLVSNVKSSLYKSQDALIFRYNHNGEISKICDKNTMTGYEVIKEFCLENLDICMCSIIIKREIIQENNILYTEGSRYGEDHEFILKSLYHAHDVVILNNILFYYIYRVGSAVNTYSIARLDSLESANRLCEYIKSINMYNKELEAYLGCYIFTKIDQNLMAFLLFDSKEKKIIEKKLKNQIKLYSKKWIIVEKIYGLSNKNVKKIFKIVVIKYFINQYILLRKFTLYMKKFLRKVSF